MSFFELFRRERPLVQVTIEVSRGVAQPGSASGLGPEGREFESHRPDHFKKANDKPPSNTGWFFFDF